MDKKKLVEFIVAAVADFARKKQIPVKDAFLYLHAYKGMTYLCEFYEVEHTLPPAMTAEALSEICRRNGGMLP
jgi:hypothetical protein